MHGWRSGRGQPPHGTAQPGLNRRETPTETQGNDEMLITLNFVREEVPHVLPSKAACRLVRVLLVEDSDAAGVSQAMNGYEPHRAVAET